MVRGNKILLTEYGGTVASGSYQWMVMASPVMPGGYSYSNPQDEYCHFALIPVDVADPSKGYLLRYRKKGRRDAYLMANRTNPLFWTKIIFNSKKIDGNYETDRYVWKFTS